MQTTRTREGDVMTITRTETEPAVIDFQDILDACEIVADELYNPFDCDGLEHTLHSPHLTGTWDIDSAADISEMRGSVFVNGGMNCNSGSGVVTVDPERARRDGWGYIPTGASRQVRAEMLAQEIGRTIDIICKIYRDGGTGYGVTCNYHGYHSSCWGYDDYDYAREQRQEHAEEVADQMEKDGYTVTNKPKPVDQRALELNWKRETYRRNLTADCWQEIKTGNRSYRRHRNRKGVK